MPHKATLTPAELGGVFCSSAEYDAPLFLPTQASLPWPYSFKEIIHCLTHQRILSCLISLHWSFSLIPEPLWLQQWALLNADMKISFVMQCKTFAASCHLQTRQLLNIWTHCTQPKSQKSSPFDLLNLMTCTWHLMKVSLLTMSNSYLM